MITDLLHQGTYTRVPSIGGNSFLYKMQ
uniref:Uncharacterized protein n=1 Tax=Rhizophora mucronata TaxID=61149 RepID=A0A2P2PRK6_RHIMU